jgi:hypothetical protein
MIRGAIVIIKNLKVSGDGEAIRVLQTKKGDVK